MWEKNVLTDKVFGVAIAEGFSFTRSEQLDKKQIDLSLVLFSLD